MAKAREYDDDEVVVYDTVPAGSQPREPDREETDAERKTREFFDELNGKDSQEVGYIDIYKVAGVSNFGAKDYCGREPSDRFIDAESLMIYLREQFGHGHYRILGRIEGKKGNRLNTLLSIAKRSGDENPRNLPAVIGEGSRSSELAVMMQAINQQNQNMMLMIESLRPEKKGIDLSKMFDPAFLTAASPILIMALKALFSNKRDPLSDLTHMLTITGTIKDMREEDKGGDNPDTWPALIGKVTDQLGAILPAIAANKPVPAGAPAALPAGQRPSPQPIPPIAQAFAPHLAQLVQMADAGAEPEAAARSVLTSVPPHLMPTLMGFLDSDSCIVSLGRVNPGVFERAVWFDELRSWVLDLAGAADDTGQNDSTGPDDAFTADHTTDPET